MPKPHKSSSIEAAHSLDLCILSRLHEDTISDYIQWVIYDDQMLCAGFGHDLRDEARFYIWPATDQHHTLRALDFLCTRPNTCSSLTIHIPHTHQQYSAQNYLQQILWQTHSDPYIEALLCRGFLPLPHHPTPTATLSLRRVW